MHSGNHQGTGFIVWNREQTWFWSVVNHDRDGGSVGAAATEEDAINEARRTIDEMSGHSGSRHSLVDSGSRGPIGPTVDRPNFVPFGLLWACWAINLAHYIADRMPVYPPLQAVGSRQ